ncbi:hypothetical protein ANO14919_068920 [Xylariales sp. No.14919]|nr:hypothetical protein ANO14919_068920 [Xylariales sp. No.14919]
MSNEDDINPPCWIEDPMLGQHSPYSLVVYVVARFNAVYRPLSVLTIEEADVDQVQADEIIPLCQRLSAMLADPSNRVALASELSLAADFYSNERSTSGPSIHDLPKTGGLEYFRQPDEGDRVYRDFPDFPFISTCLMLAGELSSDCPMRLRPLGTRFRDGDATSYSMVVFDVSDLEQSRYGIVAFKVQHMVLVESLEMWRVWTDWGRPLGGERELRVGEPQSRTPLSVREFATKFGVKIPDDASALDGVPLVEPDAFRLIWPSESSETENGRVSQGPPQSGSSIDSSGARLARRIEGILQTDGFSLPLLNGVRKLRAFQQSLRRVLLEKPDYLNGPEGSGLLGLAFEAETHLNLVQYDGLSGEVIRAALDRDELKQIQSVSICIDRITETPRHLADALFPSGMKHDFYILQSPSRNSDDRAIEFMQELCRVPDRLSLSNKIFISGIYSSALRRQPWVPASGPGLPTSAFPVQYIFHRTQYSPQRRWWTTRSGYIGDGMLSPLASATGLLAWLGRLASRVLLWAVGAPDLEDPLRTQVSPIPAEEFKLQGLQPRDAVRRPLCSGTWCVVVSTEKYGDTARDEANSRGRGWAPSEAQYIGFALVRLLVDVVAEDSPITVAAEDVQVCGLAEFLGQTSPAPVDAALVERRLAEAEEKISHWNCQGRLGEGLRWLRQLEVEEAIEVLNMGLKEHFGL